MWGFCTLFLRENDLGPPRSSLKKQQVRLAVAGERRWQRRGGLGRGGDGCRSSTFSPRTGSTAFWEQIIETFRVSQILEQIVKVVALSQLQVVERILGVCNCAEDRGDSCVEMTS